MDHKPNCMMPRRPTPMRRYMTDLLHLRTMTSSATIHRDVRRYPQTVISLHYVSEMYIHLNLLDRSRLQGINCSVILSAYLSVSVCEFGPDLNVRWQHTLCMNYDSFEHWKAVALSGPPLYKLLFCIIVNYTMRNYYTI